MDDTMLALEVHDNGQAKNGSPGQKYFLDVFCIRQSAKGDFNPAIVQEVIKDIGYTAMIALPWESPETLKRIWCVYEVFCTVQGGSKLDITILENKRISKFQRSSSEHSVIFTNVLDCLKNSNVEFASARNEADRDKILKLIRDGPGVLKTNLVVTSAMANAIQQELESEERQTVHRTETGDLPVHGKEVRLPVQSDGPPENNENATPAGFNPQTVTLGEGVVIGASTDSAGTPAEPA